MAGAVSGLCGKLNASKSSLKRLNLAQNRKLLVLFFVLFDLC